MGTLTLRLPEKMDQQLTKLAEDKSKTRSEIARAALEKFLRDIEREGLMAEMVASARILATNPKARAEAIAIAEEFLPLDNEALDIAEGRKPGEAWPEEIGERWWK